jgi:hypothetical protein
MSATAEVRASRLVARVSSLAPFSRARSRAPSAR